MKRSKHGLFVFPPKKTLIWRRHCSIGQSCCSMTSKRRIYWFLESSRAWSFFNANVRLTNQKPPAFVSVRYITNQIAQFPFVCCFCFVRAFSFQGHTKIALTFRKARRNEILAVAVRENEKEPLKLGQISGYNCTYLPSSNVSESTVVMWICMLILALKGNIVNKLQTATPIH